MMPALFTTSKRIRIFFIVCVSIVLVLSVYTTFFEEKALNLVIYLPCILVSYAFVFTKYIVTDRSFTIKHGIGREHTITWQMVKDVKPIANGFRIDYQNASGKTKTCTIRYVEDGEHLLQLVQNQFKAITTI